MNKWDSIVDRLGKIDTTLASQHEVLKEHVRRTQLLEEEVKPIKKHVAMIEGAMRLIGLVGVLATIVEVIHILFK